MLSCVIGENVDQHQPSMTDDGVPKCILGADCADKNATTKHETTLPSDMNYANDTKGTDDCGVKLVFIRFQIYINIHILISDVFALFISHFFFLRS